MPIAIPQLSAFIYPFLGSLCVFQLTYQQITFSTSKYIQTIMHNPDYAYAQVQSVLLGSVMLTLGGYIGTYTAIHLLSIWSPRRIFMLSDCIYIIASMFVFLIRDGANQAEISVYVLFRVLTGLSCGINYSMSAQYIKSMSNKIDFQTFSKLIPIQLQAGYLFGILVNISEDRSFDYFALSQILAGIPSIIRILVYVFCFQRETPEYYMYVIRNTEKTKRCLLRIHGKGVNIQEFQKQQSLVKQFKAESLYKDPYINKYFKCILLALITELTGQYIITNDFIFAYIPSEYVIFGLLCAIIATISNVFLAQMIKKTLLIYIGQGLVVAGLLVLAFIPANSKIVLVGILLFYPGYALGIGTFIYSIIPLQIPDLGVIHCVTFQWFFQILNQCLVGLINSRIYVKRNKHENYKLLQFLTLFYSICSAVSLGILVMLFRQKKRNIRTSIPLEQISPQRNTENSITNL